MINKEILTQAEIEALLGSNEPRSEERPVERIPLQLLVKTFQLELDIYWKNFKIWDSGDFIPLMDTLPTKLVSILQLSTEPFKINAEGRELALGKLELWNNQLGLRILEVIK